MVSQTKPPQQAPKSRSPADIIVSVSRFVNIVAIIALMAMMLLTVADVFLRYTIKKPIMDSVNMSQYLMICTVFFALAWCAVKNGHVSVDLIVARFSKRVQAAIDSITYLLGFGFCLMMTWRSFVEATIAQKNNQTSPLLHIPSYPFKYILTFGVGLLALVIFVQWLERLRKAGKG